MILGLALAWAAILAGGWLGWQLLRQNGRLLLRLEELEKRFDSLEFGDGEESVGLLVGTEAPAFELPDLAGERKSLAQFQGQPLLLVFFNPACGFCRDMLPKLAALSPSSPQEERDRGRRPLGMVTMLLVTTGDPEANRQLFEQHSLDFPVLLQKQSEVATAYQANSTPAGYLISEDGKIASQLAMGAEALLALATRGPHPEPLSHRNGEDGVPLGEGHRANRFGNRTLAHTKIKRDGLKAGTPAPDFRLPRLDGRGDLALTELRGRGVLLVFSSPGCGPCNALAPELEKFHCEHSELEVVMISKGEPQENRIKVKEHGLTFPVVLQQQWEISRRYAMFATPIAYLIDEQGIIARDVVVGVENIIDLMASATKLEGCAET